MSKLLARIAGYLSNRTLVGVDKVGNRYFTRTEEIDGISNEREKMRNIQRGGGSNLNISSGAPPSTAPQTITASADTTEKTCTSLPQDDRPFYINADHSHRLLVLTDLLPSTSSSDATAPSSSDTTTSSLAPPYLSRISNLRAPSPTTTSTATGHRSQKEGEQ
uniref:Uncharacterized protein n=1 Tax=Populus alba TaxID=43335 RepID=A0A4U5PM47_POPAL|nr:hypothetical protein D5086_0000210910 [Populus alba]